jgi:hypothetical protein
LEMLRRSLASIVDSRELTAILGTRLDRKT